MSYRLTVANDNPSLYYILEEITGTNIIDYMTLTVQGTYTSLPQIAHPMVKNSNNSKLFKNELATLTYFPNLWNNLYPNQPFSIEFWYAPHAVNSVTSILISANSTDGVFVDSKGIIFTISGQSNIYELIAPLPNISKNNHYVVCEFDGSNMYIYVNGELINSIEFNDSISKNNSLFYINNSSSSNSFYLSNLAIYRKILTSTIQKNHYSVGTDNSFFNNFTRDIGSYSKLDDDSVSVFLDSFESGQDLLNGYQVVNLGYNGIGVEPVDHTIEATRITFYALSAFVTIDGSRIDWDSNSDNFTVDISLDFGNTWALDISNHTEIAGLGRNTDVTNIGLMIRQNFVPSTGAVNFSIYGEEIYGEGLYGGQISLEPYLNSLHLVIYKNKNITFSDGLMTPTLTYAFPAFADLIDDAQAPLIVNNNAFHMSKNSNLAFPSMAKSIYGIEVLFKYSGQTSSLITIFDSRDSGHTSLPQFTIGQSGVDPIITGISQVYIDGVLKSTVHATDLPANQWILLTLVFTSALSNQPFFFNSNYSGLNNNEMYYQFLGFFYESSINVSRYLSHYNSAFGIPILLVNESTIQTLTENRWNHYNNNYGVSSG